MALTDSLDMFGRIHPWRPSDRVRAFAARRPNAAPVLDAMPEGASRLYEIAVDEWVLFDEENYRSDPRRVIPGQ